MTMWGWNTEALRAALENKPPVATVNHEEMERARKLKEAEKNIIELGIGMCVHCKEEIQRHDNLSGQGYVWESEFFVGWCPDSPKGNKHEPKIEVKE